MFDSVKEYFSFSKKERVGIIVLMMLIGAVGFAPAFFSSSGDMQDSLGLREFGDEIVVLEKKSVEPAKTYQENFGVKSSSGRFKADDEISKVVLFEFDPNTIDLDGWRRLGVKEKTALTILKYRDKGGQFRNADDILKIYGLSESDKKRLVPFVRIAGRKQGSYPGKISDSPNNRRDFITSNTERQAYFTKKIATVIEINKADSVEWKSLPGIGAVLSQRIVKYRDRLGGFSRIEQVAEIYGLQDSTYQKLKSYLRCDGVIRKLNINEVTPDILEQHPYLRRPVARAIVDYRSQHGPFKDLSELKQLAVITTELYEKISPYLEI